MAKLVGQFMRIGGLLVEMLGVYAVMKGTEGKLAATLQLPGFEPIPLAWVGVAVGFVFWLTGTVLVYWSRSSRKASRLEIDESLDR
jgi:hypothetical protein